MKNIYAIGKIDYLKCGQKENLVTLEWELKDGVFSMSGNVWNRTKTDIYCGGQIVDQIAKLFPHNKRVQEMFEVWNQWHLNDMQAGCEHQRKLGWDKNEINAPCPTCGYKYGSAWLKKEIPHEIIEKIESWGSVLEAVS